MKKLKAAFLLTGVTGDEGPIMFGFATELTAVEIAEALLADPQFMDDVPASERGNRKIMLVGMFGVSTQIEMNQMLRTIRYPWKLVPEGQTLKWWVANFSGATLTTGAVAHMNGVAVTEWERD